MKSGYNINKYGNINKEKFFINNKPFSKSPVLNNGSKSIINIIIVTIVLLLEQFKDKVNGKEMQIKGFTN
jgi:hypothetical protein